MSTNISCAGLFMLEVLELLSWPDPEGVKGRGSGPPPPPPGKITKSQVSIGFLRNTGTDPLEKQLDPFGPSVKYELMSKQQNVLLRCGG